MLMQQIDPRIFLLLIIVIVLLCVISYSGDNHDNDNHDDNVYVIKIDPKTYEEMVDIVTSYSLLMPDYERKLILIYLATFHLFDMNFGFNSIKRVDDRLVSYPYIPNNVNYPSGNLHHNLQKAIITHITEKIDGSERQLINSFNSDRKIVDVYLRSLFSSIGVI